MKWNLLSNKAPYVFLGSSDQGPIDFPKHPVLKVQFADGRVQLRPRRSKSMTLSMEPWNWRLESPVSWIPVFLSESEARGQESWPFHSKIHPGFTEKEWKIWTNTCASAIFMLIKIDSHEPSPFFEKLWSSPLWWRLLHLGLSLFTIYLKDCIRCWLKKKVIQSDGFHSYVFFGLFTPKHGDDPVCRFQTGWFNHLATFRSVWWPAHWWLLCVTFYGRGLSCENGNSQTLVET